MSRKNSNHTGLKVFLILLILLLIGASAFMITLSLKLPGREVSVHPTAGAVVLPTQAETEPPTEAPTETTVPEPEKVIATARISAQGDLLMHKPIFDDRSIVKQADGSYDFSPVFKYFADTVKEYDYAIANLETTFGGDNFPYQGNPAFNCPDPFLDSVVDAGYDMLLTANNHSNDTLQAGILGVLASVPSVPA